MSASSTAAFFEFDYGHTLYPLTTNLLLVQKHEKELAEYIYQKVLDKNQPACKFLVQQRVYAPKRHGHLRRTFKLDPVAEYFLYDLVFRNRTYFKKSPNPSRDNYGYRFSNGKPMPISTSYRAYRTRVSSLLKAKKSVLAFDVASYFNSLYHHDLVAWLEDEVQATPKDVSAFGEFLREINAGRSVDCFPQGIYPAKMIGNSFLRSIDQNFQLQSQVLLRFMDDFCLFDNDQAVLERDFDLVQKLLGEKGLNVNPSKTNFGSDAAFDIKRQISKIRTKLKTIVEEIEFTESDIETYSTVKVRELNPDEVGQLQGLLSEPKLEEEDAEIILALLQKHSADALEHLPMLLDRFPNLSKSIYRFCQLVADKQELNGILLRFLGSIKSPLEYQLFWVGKIVEDALLGHVSIANTLPKLWERCDEIGGKIAMAKVLEIPEKKFGMFDLKEQFLKTGQSDWLSWASAIGSRCLAKAKRNHLLKYFANGSNMNHIVGGCALKL